MRTPKKSFCFAPQYNSPQKGHPLGTDGKELLRHDATGAFHPYMNAFKKLYSQDGGEVATLRFDNHGTAEHIFKQVVQGIWYAPPGWTRWRILAMVARTAWPPPISARKPCRNSPPRSGPIAGRG